MFTTLLFLAAALAPVASQRYMTQEEKKEMLDAHNAYRRKAVVDTGASDMRIMEWNDDLEKFAYGSAQKCKLEHSGEERHKVGGEGSTGENIMWSSASSIPNKSIAVKMWYDEIASYNYDTLECKVVCGHYTQVVWSKSFKLGCAVTSEAQCKSGTYIFCNYAPTGNYVGEKPFQKGEPCQGCKGDWTNYCINKLCSKTSTQGSADSAPTGKADQPDGDTVRETNHVFNSEPEVSVSQATTHPGVIINDNQATADQEAILKQGTTSTTSNLILVTVKEPATAAAMNFTSDEREEPSTSHAQGTTQRIMNLLLTLIFCACVAYIM